MLCVDCRRLSKVNKNDPHENKAKTTNFIQGICISCGKRITWNEILCTDCKKPIATDDIKSKRSIRGRCLRLFRSIKKNDYKT